MQKQSFKAQVKFAEQANLPDKYTIKINPALKRQDLFHDYELQKSETNIKQKPHIQVGRWLTNKIKWKVYQRSSKTEGNKSTMQHKYTLIVFVSQTNMNKQQG